MGESVRRGLLLSILLFLAIAAARCDSKPGREGPVNPFDPDNPNTGGAPHYGLDAVYAEGRVSLKWNAFGVPGLQGITIFRRSQFDSLFARVDTAGGTAKTWVEPHPVYFAKSWYRIAPIGADGSEADTTGRGLDSVSVPPFLEIAGGAGETAVRQVSLFVGAAFADEMLLAEDTLLEGVSWEPFDSARTWTLSEGKGTKRIYMKVRREGGEESPFVSDTIATAATNGTVILAGGASTTARRWVQAEVSGSNLTRLILSADENFGDDGDLIPEIDSTKSVDTLVSWLLDGTLMKKVLFAEFSTEFGVDTVVADSIWPADLSFASLVLDGGNEIAYDCEVTLTITADAIYMKLSPDTSFADEEWVPYKSIESWEIGDTSGTYFVHAQFKNDFYVRGAADSIEFKSIPLEVLIDSPAEGSYFVTGDSVSIRGGTVAASCRAAPDSVFVTVGNSLFAVALDDSTAWASPYYTFAESPSGTLAVHIVAAVTDDTHSTAADTVVVFLVPAE
ncbi:MAG: hypothetical protein ABIK65_15330 [Candidatus Eisenbacteria bacterium]